MASNFFLTFAWCLLGSKIEDTGLFDEASSQISVFTDENLKLNVNEAVDLIVNQKPIMFELIEPKVLDKIFKLSSFPVTPTVKRHYIFVHKLDISKSEQIFLTKEYLHFNKTRYLFSSTGQKRTKKLSYIFFNSFSF